MTRHYYSVRTGKKPLKLDLPMLRKLFFGIYSALEKHGYFEEAFGYACVDGGAFGSIGHDREAYFFLQLRKENLWPIHEVYVTYYEEDVFDIIELLFDLISKPVDGWYHQYCDCGMHYNSFDKSEGRKDYRREINKILRDYKDGYELSANGEILHLGDKGMESILHAEIVEYDPLNVDKQLAEAVQKFRLQASSVTDRKNAVRALADILEFLKPKLKGALNSKDESDLFNIANNFAIRHHNEKQKTDYDKMIWLSWMFYFYLATIHAMIRILKRQIKN